MSKNDDDWGVPLEEHDDQLDPSYEAKRRKLKCDFEAWWVNDDDQKQSNKLSTVKLADLELIGVEVLYIRVDINKEFEDACPWTSPSGKELTSFRKENGLDWASVQTFSSKQSDYKSLVGKSFEEHLQNDDEGFYIIDGCYFIDIRSNDDKWIRIKCQSGHVVTLPKGIYRRFTPDDDNYAKVMRLSEREPTTAVVRCEKTDVGRSRQSYLRKYGSDKPEVWWMADEITDSRAENRNKNAPAVEPETLEELGVLSFLIPVEQKYENALPWEPKTDKQKTDRLAHFRQQMGMNYADVITINKDKLPGYEDKIKMFFEEHLHDDDEVRYILDGSGFFDVRSKGDKWIRIHCKAGHLITLPKGIYHRFTPDANDFAQAMRLFVGEPIWTPVNRSENADGGNIRKGYLSLYGPSAGPEAWWMSSEITNPRAENKRDGDYSVEPSYLENLGVHSYIIPVEEKYENALPWVPTTERQETDALSRFRKKMGMNYADVITINKDKLPGYEDKIKMFFEEHLHDDDEVRYIVDGSGFFDVRSKEDKWIRIHCKAGHLITLPKGIYHRFTPDANDFAQAMRLFVGEPIWTPVNRSEVADQGKARCKYTKKYLS